MPKKFYRAKPALMQLPLNVPADDDHAGELVKSTMELMDKLAARAECESDSES